MQEQKVTKEGIDCVAKEILYHEISPPRGGITCKPIFSKLSVVVELAETVTPVKFGSRYSMVFFHFSFRNPTAL